LNIKIETQILYELALENNETFCAEEETGNRHYHIKNRNNT